MGADGVSGLETERVGPAGAAVPAARARVLRPIGERLLAARRVVLTTHLNADGDGAGSECAIAIWLESRGVQVSIVNPTPYPPGLRFLVHRPELVQDLGAGGEEAVRAADAVLVLDTSEPNRIGDLYGMIDPERTMVIDHHPAGPVVVGTLALQDITAAATGELVYDLVRLFEPEIPRETALGMYVAMVSDTGSFRFSNTSPRTHLIAADLLGRGVDPEVVFQKLYATYPRRRVELLREALGTLETDPELGISWMVVSDAVTSRLQSTPEDFEGLVDHARSIEGTEVAILFRETATGHTRISIRSNGKADVNAIAREFDGGGHVKAAGAYLAQAPAEAVPRVIDRVRAVLRAGSQST